MRTSSAKAKGRRLCTKIKAMMHTLAPWLKSDDIHVTSSGETGPDLKLSPKAQEVYPFVVECKNQEHLQIWKALEQALSHKGMSELIPVLFF